MTAPDNKAASNPDDHGGASPEKLRAPEALDVYHRPARAQAYRGKYERSLGRRLTHMLEVRALRRALKSVDVQGEVLDIPCGAGRMTPLIMEVAKKVTCSDASAPMLEEAKDALGGRTAGCEVAFQLASALDLPFATGRFDGVVCWRLIHHMKESAHRKALLRELHRVARRWVIMTFSDAGTIKGRLRTMRGAHKESSHSVIERAVLESEARDAGLTLLSTNRLSSATSLVTVAVLRTV